MSEATTVATAVKRETKICPWGDRVLVRLPKKKDRSDGGILLPDVAQERPASGRVLDVSGAPRANGLTPGCVVYYARHSGEVVHDDDTDTDFLLLRDHEIMAFESHPAPSQ